jgi:hypothetical protein
MNIKITKIFVKNVDSEFYCDYASYNNTDPVFGFDTAICYKFVKHLLGESISIGKEESKLKITATTKNPKKKGWSKITWDNKFQIYSRKTLFTLSYFNTKELEGRDFWIKVEEIKD